MIPVVQDWHHIALSELVYQAEQESWSDFNAELVSAEESLRKKEAKLPHAETALDDVKNNLRMERTAQAQASPEMREIKFVFQKQDTPVNALPVSHSLIRQAVAPFLTVPVEGGAEPQSEVIARLAENQKLIQKQMILDESQFKAWLDEVVTAARYIQKGDMKHLAFQLSPKDLGDMDVFISEEQGSLAVHIFAETKATQEKLKKQLPELMAQLEVFYHQNLKVKILPKPRSALFQKLTDASR